MVSNWFCSGVDRPFLHASLLTCRVYVCLSVTLNVHDDTGPGTSPPAPVINPLPLLWLNPPSKPGPGRGGGLVSNLFLNSLGRLY